MIGCFIDCDEGTIHFTKNGRSLDKAFDIPPRGFAFYPGTIHPRPPTHHNQSINQPTN